MALGRGGQVVQHAAISAGLGDIFSDLGLCLRVDDGTDISGQMPRVAQTKLIHRTKEHCLELLCHILLDVEAAQRRTPLARRLKGRCQHIAHSLFGQGGAVHDHGVQPAGFGNKRCAGGKVFGHGGLNALGGFGRAGEGHAIHPRIRGERGPHRGTIARQQLQHVARHAGLVQQARGVMRDDGRLFGGFGQHAIACRKRACNLPGENGQRKVPRADAGEDAARGVLKAFGLACIIAQEIHRFAQFAQRVGLGFAGFARKDGKDRAEMVFIQIGGLGQDTGAAGGIRAPRVRGGEGGLHILGAGLGDCAQTVAGPGRVLRGMACPALCGACHKRRDREACRFPFGAGLGNRVQILGTGQIPAARVAAVWAEQIWPIGDFRVSPGHTVKCGKGAGGDGFGRHVLIYDLVYEG